MVTDETSKVTFYVNLMYIRTVRSWMLKTFLNDKMPNKSCFIFLILAFLLCWTVCFEYCRYNPDTIGIPLNSDCLPLASCQSLHTDTQSVTFKQWLCLCVEGSIWPFNMWMKWEIASRGQGNGNYLWGVCYSGGHPVFCVLTQPRGHISGDWRVRGLRSCGGPWGRLLTPDILNQFSAWTRGQK